jgi:aminopeptidase 2
MDWWAELWLNEGFATYVGWLAVDYIFPDWDVFSSFITKDYARGIRLDSMRSSHPIEVDVKSPSEVSQIFDAISYSKGASVIRMLSSYLGQKVFQNGVIKYLKKHAYSNATTLDLWAALGEASKQDVAKLMYSWTREMGFPLLNVTKEEYDPINKKMTLRLSQDRFLASGDMTAEESKSAPVWSVPIAVSSHLSNVETVHLFSEKSGAIVFPFEDGPDAYYKLNTSVTGFYRVNYTDEGIARLRSAIPHLNKKDRIGVLSDVFALAKSGVGSTSQVLDLLSGFLAEEEYL